MISYNAVVITNSYNSTKHVTLRNKMKGWGRHDGEVFAFTFWGIRRRYNNLWSVDELHLAEIYQVFRNKSRT